MAEFDHNEFTEGFAKNAFNREEMQHQFLRPFLNQSFDPEDSAQGTNDSPIEALLSRLHPMELEELLSSNVRSQHGRQETTRATGKAVQPVIWILNNPEELGALLQEHSDDTLAEHRVDQFKERGETLGKLLGVYEDMYDGTPGQTLKNQLLTIMAVNLRGTLRDVVIGFKQGYKNGLDEAK